MKKNILKIAIVSVLAAVSVVSCREDITDIKPYSQVDASAAFSTPSLIQLSVNGVYNAAQMGIFNGTEESPNSRGYVFGAAYFQQNEARGEDVVNTQAFYQITYEANYDPTTPNNVYYWVDGYKLVNKANIVLNGLDQAVAKGVITNDVANMYRAEMRFFRALAHLELVKHFAMPYQHTSGATHLGVPYRTIPTLTPEDINANLKLGRHSVADVYKLALEDLNFAEANAQTKAQKAGQEKIVRVTKGAAIAAKIVAKQSMRDWDGVITEFAKLQGSYVLEANPLAPFSNNYGNNESIFSILNTANTNPGVNGALAAQFNNRSLIAISPILWNDAEWLADDKRRTETAEVASSTTRKGVFTRKYKDITNYSDGSPIYRYAEMVLAAAEAQARKENLPVALSLLNTVRNRSLANPATQAHTLITLPTKQAMVKAILKERRIELLCEGKRWGDIHRLLNDDIAPTNGIPAKVANGFPLSTSYKAAGGFTGTLTAPIPSTDRRFLWPIPLQEINNNPTLAAQQNPGW